MLWMNGICLSACVFMCECVCVLCWLDRTLCTVYKLRKKWKKNTLKNELYWKHYCIFMLGNKGEVMCCCCCCCCCCRYWWWCVSVCVLLLMLLLLRAFCVYICRLLSPLAQMFIQEVHRWQNKAARMGAIMTGVLYTTNSNNFLQFFHNIQTLQLTVNKNVSATAHTRTYIYTNLWVKKNQLCYMCVFFLFFIPFPFLFSHSYLFMAKKKWIQMLLHKAKKKQPNQQQQQQQHTERTDKNIAQKMFSLLL